LSGGTAALVPVRRRVALAVGLLGCAICMVGGGAIGTLGSASLLLVLVGRRAERTWGLAGLTAWRVGHVCALVGAMVAVAVSVDTLAVAVGMVCWLAVHRAWTGATAGDDRITLLLALLQALLGCILTVSAWLAPLFVGLAALAPVLLLLCTLSELGPRRVVGADSFLLRQPRLMLGLVAGVWGIAAVAFAVTPRLDAARLLAGGQEPALAGFNDEVDLGALGEIKDNPAIVARLRVRDAAGNSLQTPIYLRGTALDRFDGTRWSQWLTASQAPSPPRGLAVASPADRVLEIVLEPLGEPILPGLAELVAVEGVAGFDDMGWPGIRLNGVSRDGNGTFRWAGSGLRVAYRARSSLQGDGNDAGREGAPWTALEREAGRRGLWRSLPDDLDPRVAALAAAVLADPANRSGVAGLGGGAGPLDARGQMLVLEAWLRRNLSYTLVPDPSDEGQDLSGFLFVSGRGHCEYFATALAVMLRTQGVDARVVNGFFVTEWNPFGAHFVVRQRDAHSWVEARPASGSDAVEAAWVRLDATPPSDDEVLSSTLSQVQDWIGGRWSALVLDYDLGVQMAAVQQVGQVLRLPRASTPAGALAGAAAWLPLGGLLLVLVAVAVLIRRGLAALAGERRRRRRAAGPVERAWRRALRLVRRRGWDPPASLPPVEMAEWLVVQAGPAALPLRELAWLHYRVRYGGASDLLLKDDARMALAALATLQRAERSR
jgi:protein-glutamine gamma-glutamyltransferase